MHDDPTLPLGDSPSPSAGIPEARDQWGPFRLLARVGAGGFGEVYRAWDPNLEREVALKLLLPGAVGGDEEYKAMLREARAMASVQHENIVHVYGIDRHDGRVGFWTDFVKGKTLSALLGQQGPFGYREAALIGIDLSRALSAVHRAGLLHRDIKAENVMREEGGRILLMDFGLSAGERTIMTQLAGTPNYMAPELFDGGKASVCTDIYAMGVLLYYLVIGEYPARLTGLSIQEAKIALGHRTPLMDLRSDLPEPFLRTVRIAMELDPHKRFASAGQLAEGLTECLGSGLSSITPTHTPAYTPTYAPAPPAYTPAYTPPYAPVSATPPPGPVPPPPRPAPPPPKPLVEPATWANLFGLIRNRRLSKRAKWALLGLTIFAFQKWWRDDSSTEKAKHKSSVSAPVSPDAPVPPVTDSDDNADTTSSDSSSDKSSSDKSSDDDYAKAEALLERPYKDSNVDAAVKGFQKILDQNPKSARAEAGLGRAYFAQYNATHDPNLLALAKAATSQAIEMDPSLAQAYVTQARMSAKAGQMAQAMQQAQKAISLDPRNAAAYDALSQVYQDQGRTDNAIASAQKAIDLAPEESASATHLLSALAGYYASSNKPDKSLPLLRKSLALAPNDPLVVYRAGETYELLGQRAKAVPLIVQALTLGYGATELQSNPRLASLRAEPAIRAAIAKAKAKAKK